MGILKWAVDDAAKKYWAEYYQEYGRTWTRDIPRRVKKAMVQHAKLASQDSQLGIVTPIATSISKEGVKLEGMFRSASGDNFMFYAEFDHDGAIGRFDSVKLAKYEG